MPLRDVLTPRPRILFVGINPSLRSEAVGHHFAGPGNPFWRLLYAARLVPVPLGFADDARLAEFGLALTNLCPRATRAASELRPDERARGRRRLTRRVERLRPRVVAFVGIGIYREFFGHVRSGGPGPKPERIAGARVFVVPNPSGLNASFPGFADKRVWFARLRAFTARDAAAVSRPAPTSPASASPGSSAGRRPPSACR
ncbi:MAG TPA: mismatch-specific DNA-glycosylase [Pseudonocardia sp.]|nr:mismatch-specific DNA-glycosylase [Pseudonocardia sp.]